MVFFRFKAATVSCIFIILSHNVSGYIRTVYTALYPYVNKNLMIIDKSLLFSGPSLMRFTDAPYILLDTETRQGFIFLWH